MGIDPVLTFGLPRTFRGPSAELARTSCARICFSDYLQEWSRGPRRHAPENILVASFKASMLWLNG